MVVVELPEGVERIALSGAHGVGKTTLARRLGSALELPVVGEAARALLGTCPWADWRASGPAPLLQESLWWTVQWQGAVTERGVMDRTLWDVVAYSTFHGIRWDGRVRVDWDWPDVILFFRWPGYRGAEDGREIDRILASILPKERVEVEVGDVIKVGRVEVMV